MQRKTLFKIAFGTTISFLIIGLFFIVHTIWNAPLEKFDVSTKQIKPTIDKTGEIEELTTVSYKNLKNYHLFSQSKASFQDFIKVNTEAQNLEVDGQSIIVKKSITLTNILENDCSRIFCFQSKMAFDEIPSLFWKGLIGVEDSRFLEHKGIDVRSIIRAIIIDIKSMKLVQGGSTITQQLVKNLYFTNEKRLIRKLKELVLAVYIEWKFSKEKILEAYFNEIFWGVKQGVYIKGIYSASIFYFSKRPSDLSEYEVSILISLLKGPGYYNPLGKLNRLQKRTRYVFNRLKTLNYISDKLIAWNQTDWQRWKNKLETLEKKKPYQSIYYISKFDAPAFSAFEKFILLTNIYEQLDKSKKQNPKIQLALKASFYDFKSNVNFSFYSNPYRDSSLALNKEKHQVGSILKPIIYSFYIQEGYSLSDNVSTLPIKLNLKSGVWSPREAHNVKIEELSLKEALQLSYNRPLIRLAKEIGFETIEKYLVGYIPSIKKPLGEYPAQLLGAVELSVNDTLAIYKNFIDTQCQLVRSGKKLEDTIIYSMADPSATTIRRQVGEVMGGLNFFGKTGTSNNGNDNWFVGFDGRLLSVIWLGNEGEKSDVNLNLYGGTTSFKVYKNFLKYRGKQVGDIGCHHL